jgi:hypothetical protein
MRIRAERGTPIRLATRSNEQQERARPPAGERTALPCTVEGGREERPGELVNVARPTLYRVQSFGHRRYRCRSVGRHGRESGFRILARVELPGNPTIGCAGGGRPGGPIHCDDPRVGDRNPKAREPALPCVLRDLLRKRGWRLPSEKGRQPFRPSSADRLRRRMRSSPSRRAPADTGCSLVTRPLRSRGLGTWQAYTALARSGGAIATTCRARRNS